MGATTRDIFGDAGGAQPAIPGSYGHAPRGYRLPDATRVGLVRLQIADLARSKDFYEQVLGLHVVESEGSRLVLAPQASDRPLVELHERKGARPAPRRGVLGLYHFAILMPDRPSLGRFARHLGEIGARAGASDHLVSEAFYLQDPDNLGIEVYADRPRETWRHINRELLMATDPIDVEALVRAGGDAPWTGMPAGTSMGHVHLHVGDIERAAEFYSDALGFDKMVWHYPGALFLASGGYHHHLGTNTWAGAGAIQAPEENARLLEWTIELPNATSVTDAADALGRTGHVAEQEGTSAAPEIVTHDPWGTQVRLKSRELGARSTSAAPARSSS
jgi:catechol 2,3-dioxygenase